MRLNLTVCLSSLFRIHALLCRHRHLVFQIPEPAPKIIKWNLLMYSTVMIPFFSVYCRKYSKSRPKAGLSLAPVGTNTLVLKHWLQNYMYIVQYEVFDYNWLIDCYHTFPGFVSFPYSVLRFLRYCPCDYSYANWIIEYTVWCYKSYSCRIKYVTNCIKFQKIFYILTLGKQEQI